MKLINHSKEYFKKWKKLIPLCSKCNKLQIGKRYSTDSDEFYILGCIIIKECENYYLKNE